MPRIDGMRSFWQRVKALNDSRKEMTERGVEQAVEQIETMSLKDDKVLVVYLPDCHESIAGIIAGRIREVLSTDLCTDEIGRGGQGFGKVH